MAYFDNEYDWERRHLSVGQKIRRWFKYNPIVDFFYDYHGNGICGPGYRSYRQLNEGRLGLVISIILVICFVGYLILK